MFEVTFFPILAAGIASVLIGFIWYHPKVLGSIWMREAGISPQAAEEGKKQMPLMVFGGLLSSMLVAWVMNHLGVALGIFDWIGAVFDLAFWVWIGFVAPIMLGSVLWERKSLTYYAINIGYWLFSIVAMAIILVVLAA